ncbi:Ig-like domain-containing protein [Acinetobacter sp. ABJ-A23_2]|uniref:Ig-like domain-containing protein n=1 Tax=Acinetobacter sp. ABJ-A23_2 TaxID=3376991 RepID=UPI0037CA9255
MQNIFTFIKNGQKITLDANSVKSVKDIGNGVEITLKNGEIIQADSYSVTSNIPWVEQVSTQQVENNSEVDKEVDKGDILKEKSVLHSQGMLWGGAAIALGGGIAVAASGGGSSSDSSASADHAPPSSLTHLLSHDGKTVTGLTESGATVIVENASGQVIGSAKAGTDGTFSINLDKAYTNGEVLKISAQDAAGNGTVKQDFIAPDTTAPSSLTVAIDTTGKVITGTTEANASVTVKDIAGKVVGSTVADATGKYLVTLDQAYLNGESLSATASDKAGNTTEPTILIVPDTTAPSNLTASMDASGNVVTGVTEAGAKVTVEYVTAVYKAATVLETQSVLNETVQATDLSKTYYFDITGTNVHVSLNLNWSTDHNSIGYRSILSGNGLNTSMFGHISQPGNGSYNIDLAHDIEFTTGPYSLTLYYSSSMSSSVNVNITQDIIVNTLEIDHYDKKTVGVTTADAEGNYSISLDKTYTNGESFNVIASDQTGNVTPPKNIIALDTTAPTLDTPIITGNLVEGQTEPNATVIVKNATGDIVGTSLANGLGAYIIILKTAYRDGELLKVTAIDAKGNVSSEKLVIAPDTTAPVLSNLFSYDNETGKVVFNAPSDSYTVEQNVNGTWIPVSIEGKFDWLNAEYRVIATDLAGNSSHPFTTVIAIGSGTYKPINPVVIQLIKGSTGDDYLYGGDGNDTLISNTGSDHLYGGSGNDTLIYGGNSPNVYTGLIGEAGNDTYIVDKKLLGSNSYVHILDNINEQNTLYLKSVSPDEIILKQASTDRIISFSDSTATIHFGEGQLSSIVFDDGTTWDKVQIEANIASKLLGTNGEDHLQADANYSVIYGLDGNDTIQGGIQDDYLYGGSGDDTLISNTGSDHLYGGSGNDTLIYGGNSPNVYTGLIGEAGNDTYIVDKKLLGSNSYVHILDNINEQNTLYLKSVSPDEIILKQASTDRIISFSDSTATIHFGEGQLSSIVFDDGTTWDKVQIEANIASKLLGTNGEDHLQADANYSVIYGLDGNDTIQGGIQDDYLYGSSGDDTLISNTGSDHLYGGSGNDTLIYGGKSPNVYTGLIGEAGNDTYIVDKKLLGSNSYVHILDNINEQNTLYLKSVSPDEIILKQASTDRIISFSDSTATIHFGEEQLSSIVFDDGTTWGKVQIEQHIAKTVVGTVGNDVIDTATANQTYSYTLNAGADTLIFKVLDNSDNLGGNSNGEWMDFNLAENDKLDLSQLLINDNGSLQDFITVKDTQAGVVLSVDRDGSNQSTYHSQELILLTGKHYTLEDLMASNAFIH